MSRPLTAPELAHLRTPGQKTQLFLGFRLPGTIYTAQVNGVPTGDNVNFPNDMVGVVTFDNGVGTLADIKTGMTVWVGSAAGAKDVGMCYVRKTPGASTLYVGEASEIEWANDLYLTIVDDFQIWARHVKIVSGSPVMDFDVTYSNQHTNFDPIVRMGGDVVLWRDGATVDFQWNASGSSVFGSTISAYLFTAPGAQGVSGAATATPTVTWDTDGQFVVYCQATAANGKSFTGKRIVWVYSAASMPETDFVLDNCSISYDEGGCKFDITMSTDCDITEVLDRTKVVLFAKDFYGDTEISIGPEVGRENIIATGWITRESIRWNFEQGQVSFSVYGGQEWLKRIPAFPVGLEIVTAATAWTNMAALTVDRTLWHFLHWRTTFSAIGDMNFTGNTLYAAELIGVATNLWEQMRQIAYTSIFGICGIDQFGSYYCIVEPQLVAEADRSAWPVIQTIATQDWHDSVEITRVVVPPVSMVSMSGVRVNISGVGSALFSLANGHVFKHYGSPEIIDRLLLETQAKANALCGRYIGWKNRDYEQVVVLLASNHRMTTLWPAQFYSLVITPSDTERAITYSGHLLPRRVEYQWDADSGVLTTDLYTEPETFEDLNINGDIPVGDGTFISLPPLPRLPKLPKLPPLDLFVPGLISPDSISGGPNKILIGCGIGFFYTLNGYSASPNWHWMNTGLPVEAPANIDQVFITPIGSLWMMFNDGVGTGGEAVYFAEGLGFPWVPVYTLQPDEITGIGVNPDVDEEIAMLAGTKDSQNFYLGNRDGMELKGLGVDSLYRVADIVYNQGKWVTQHEEDNIFGSQALSRFSGTGSIEINTYNPVLGDTYAASQHRARSGGRYIYTWNSDSRYVRKIVDNNLAASDTTMPNVGRLITTLPCVLDCDPTGQYLMGGNSANTAKKSNDFGASWVEVAAISGYYSFENCGTPEAWLAGKAGDIKYSGDFGVSWADKTGDLVTVAGSAVGPAHVLMVGW